MIWEWAKDIKILLRGNFSSAIMMSIQLRRISRFTLRRICIWKKIWKIQGKERSREKSKKIRLKKSQGRRTNRVGAGIIHAT
jgi:hypothetical protein